MTHLHDLDGAFSLLVPSVHRFPSEHDECTGQRTGTADDKPVLVSRSVGSFENVGACEPSKLDRHDTGRQTIPKLCFIVDQTHYAASAIGLRLSSILPLNQDYGRQRYAGLSKGLNWTYSVYGLTSTHGAGSQEVSTIENITTNTFWGQGEPETADKRQRHSDSDVYTPFSESIRRVGKRDRNH